MLSLWNRFRSLSIKVYESVYERLNIHFDVYAGESLVSQDLIRKCVQTLRDKDLVMTKTKKQRCQWDTPAEKAAPSLTPGVNDAKNEDEEGSPLALAVDLTPWKLGTPVIEKSGTSCFGVLSYPGLMYIILNQRWDCCLHRSRHRRCHPNLQPIPL